MPSSSLSNESLDMYRSALRQLVIRVEERGGSISCALVFLSSLLLCMYISALWLMVLELVESYKQKKKKV